MIRGVMCRVWCMLCDDWYVVRGMGCVVYGRLCAECGILCSVVCVVYGIWHMMYVGVLLICGMRLVCDGWCCICDMVNVEWCIVCNI